MSLALAQSRVNVDSHTQPSSSEEQPLHDTANTLLAHNPRAPIRQPNSFLLFPFLPAEIRIKIWLLAYPGPRNVNVSIGKYQRKPSYKQKPLSLDIELHPPLEYLYGAHLLVNHEARALFLSKYRKIFVDFPNAAKKGRGSGWYFCYEKDSLCMSSGLMGLKYFMRCFPEDVRPVRYLDIEPNGTCFHAGEPIDFAECPIRIEDLKNLELVTVRMIPGPTKRRFLGSRWAYPAYYENCVSAIGPALAKIEGVKLAIYCDMRRGRGEWCEGIRLEPRHIAESIWRRWNSVGTQYRIGRIVGNEVILDRSVD